MQYEIIATVRLLIIAEIYGLTDAELRARSNLQKTLLGNGRPRATCWM